MAEWTLGPRNPADTDDWPRFMRLVSNAAIQARDTLIIPSGDYALSKPFSFGSRAVNVKAHGATIVANGFTGNAITYGPADGQPAWFDVRYDGPNVDGDGVAVAGTLIRNVARAEIRVGLTRTCTDGVVLHAGPGVGMNTLHLDIHCLSGCQTSLRVECGDGACINHVRFKQFYSQTWGDAPKVFSIPDGAQCNGWTFDDCRIENNDSMKPNLGRFVGGPFTFSDGYWIEAGTDAVWQMKVLPGAMVRFKGHYVPRAWHGGGVVE